MTPPLTLATGAQASRGIVAIRTTGAQPPLVLIGDGSDFGAYGRALAEHIHPDVPIYTVPGTPPGTPLPETIEGMAERSLCLLRASQAEGPYYLLGWSSGAAVAYEMAVQLLGRDQTVAFLGLLEGDCPVSLTAARALDTYVVHPLPIPVHVFVPLDDPPAAKGQTRLASRVGWSEVLAAERIRRVSVAGSRTPVSDAPHAPELGRAVSDAIVQAWGQPRRVPEAQYRPQLTIQTGHEQHAVLFCLPGAGDSVVAFTGLADALGDAWPVQGLQTRGLDGELVPHSTVEAAAAMHVRAIHDVQPRGAVHLLGHSFGGWLAFEVAHQLRNSGRSLASLTLIDSEPPGTDGVLGREYTGSEAMLELVAVLELAAGKSLGIDRASAEACAPPARLRLLHAACVRVGLMPRSSRPEALRGVLRAFSTALRTRYRPQLPYPDVVRLVLVSDPRCDERANRHQHQQTVEGWRRWAPLLAPCQAPGNHVAVLRPPHVRVLAEWLSGTSGKADGHVTRASRHAEA